MKYLLIIALLVASLWAGDLEKGLDAYNKKHYKEALKLLNPLAIQGNPKAQNNIGDMYYYGEGVKKNFKEAVKWYQKAAEQGNSDAQYNLGCKKRSKSDTYDTSVRTPMTVLFGQ